MIRTNYYIFITGTGKKIPVKTKVTIKSLSLANYFYDEEIRCFYPIDIIRYYIEGGKL